MAKRKNTWKKVTAAAASAILAVSMLGGCGASSDTSKDSGGEDAAKGGKLLLMSNVNSGAMYDFNIAFMDTWTQELGYTYEVIYGDSANDPAGNLNAVKNAMTDDVVGLIAMQDGGLVDI